MSIKSIAKKAFSAYARSKSAGTTGYGTTRPLRNRPVRHRPLKRGRSLETQLASKAARAIRKAI